MRGLTEWTLLLALFFSSTIPYLIFGPAGLS